MPPVARQQSLCRCWEHAGLNRIEDVVVPQVAPHRTHVYHLYTIRHSRRDALVAHLNANGVQTAVNYPTALPFLAAYGRFKHRLEQFPNAYADQSRIVSLPMSAEITRAAGCGDRSDRKILGRLDDDRDARPATCQ